ncbi:MAG: hypothetical protein PHT88_04785 [Candidatus Moranbacteria bacterium]|nr:hypothetical protein [Candidatus Moranbacteria bacterium]
MIIDSFLAIRNTQTARSIPKNALTAAVDVDISDTGVLSARAGYVLSQTIPISSAYGTLDRRAFIVSAGVLYEVLADMSLIPIAPCTAAEFDEFKDVLVTVDGLLVQDRLAVNLKIPVPQAAPNLTLIQGGLPAGTYRAVSCFRTAAGLEGGASPLAEMTLTAPGAFTIAEPGPPAGFSAVTYVTEGDGSVFYDASGVQINPLQLTSGTLPDGELIAFHDSRLWLSLSLPNGSSVIYFSQPFHYHLWNLEADFLMIPGQVRAIKSAGAALIIGAHNALYAYADTLTVLADYGVVPGRPMVKTETGGVLIWTQRGVCSALPFANLTEAKASFAPGTQCSTALMDSNGIRRFVALTPGDGEAFNARS